MKIVVIILAAGSSNRLGTPKQLVSYNGKSLIRLASDKASKLNVHKIICVTGRDDSAIRKELEPYNILFSKNQDHSNGVGSSIVCGLKMAMEFKDLDGVLFMLSDQPLIPFNHFLNLIEIAEVIDSGCVATGFNKSYGAPALFKSEYFDELLKLDKDQGAKNIITKNYDKAVFVECGSAEMDIDTSEDLKKLRKLESQDVRGKLLKNLSMLR